jgi:hypothetical protein
LTSRTGSTTPTTLNREKRILMEPNIISRVPLGDNREVRISRIPNGTSDEYIRVGINLLPSGDDMSGAVFPAAYLNKVIAALREAK